MSDADLARRALALLDLTELADDAGEAEIDALCGKALSPIGPPAAVCVWPRHVPIVRDRLAGTGIRLATVVNFPSGTGEVDEVVAQTKGALDNGAEEIDLVLPYRRFLAGDEDFARRMVMAVRAAVDGPRRLKVILETGAMPDEEAIRRASRLAIDGGADFIKTSTGKSPVSATPEAARAMLRAIRDAGRSGLKVSGGIRTLGDAATYLALCDEMMGAGWATPEMFRFGASGLHGAIAAALSGKAPAAPTQGY